MSDNLCSKAVPLSWFSIFPTCMLQYYITESKSLSIASGKYHCKVRCRQYIDGKRHKNNQISNIINI